MSITSYATLKSAIADWLLRDDLDSQIPEFIQLAEGTLNDVLRASHMVANDTVAISSGRLSLPSDALEIAYVQVAGSENEPLEQVTPQQLLSLRRSRTRLAGNPKFFAVVGRDVLVTPSPSGSVSVDIDYYQKIPALSDINTTNWLLEEAPHIYLYTSLLHASSFLMDDIRYQILQGAVSQQILGAVKSSQTLSFDDVKTAGFSLKSTLGQPAGNVANPVASTTIGG